MSLMREFACERRCSGKFGVEKALEVAVAPFLCLQPVNFAVSYFIVNY
ncbi:hypothetical protein OHAE_3365 [Ochrobactrum soli]|uniref:Uncharacterized protein n=1 Tax=Ochrobactrum soli TaxID=2448455 RepID=A0A2P9HH95_9HYPH|nr:hypothetical protein OHAE_3365 [[Ochrobactrum] soli]